MSIFVILGIIYFLLFCFIAPDAVFGLFYIGFWVGIIALGIMLAKFLMN